MRETNPKLTKVLRPKVARRPTCDTLAFFSGGGASLAPTETPAWDEQEFGPPTDSRPLDAVAASELAQHRRGG